MEAMEAAAMEAAAATERFRRLLLAKIFASMLVWLFVQTFVCLSVCLSVCLFVCDPSRAHGFDRNDLNIFQVIASGRRRKPIENQENRSKDDVT